MIKTGEIISYDGNYLVIKPDEDIKRELLQKQALRAEIVIEDGRTISPDQRRKIFAIVNDISDWSGYKPEPLRQYLIKLFAKENDLDPISLRTSNVTIAKEFISYLIEFCFKHNVPTQKPLIEHSEDIYKYMYKCLEYRKCVVCNDYGHVHHVDRVGMGRDRETINHMSMLAIALCGKHHRLSHNREKEFFEQYHIFGIKLDHYLCQILNLNTK